MEANRKDNEMPNSPQNAQEKTAEIVSNMALAHELVMDDDFKLQELPKNSIEKHIKAMVHKAYWNKLQEDLDKTPPDYSHILIVIADLKENLLGLLLPQHNSLRAQITEVLDIEHIRQQIEHETLDLQQCAHFVVSVLSKLCAPVRDNEVQNLLQVSGIVNMFREIFGVIDAMKLDMANYQLQSIKPQLLQQSIEYERTKFKQYLESNPAGLQSSKVWLAKGAEEATKTTAAPSSSNTSDSMTGADDRTDAGAAGSHAPRIDILTHAYLGVLFGQPGWPYPETLIMDELRLAEIRAFLHRSTLLSSIILVTMGIVSRQLDKDAAYVGRLKDVLFVLLEGMGEGDVTPSMPSIHDQVIVETNKVLEERGFSQLGDEQEGAIRGQISAIGSPSHPIRKLLDERARHYMYGVVSGRIRHAGSQDNKSPPLPPGLSPVASELTELTNRFARLVSHNASVFKPYYEDILDGLSSPSTN